MSAPLLLLLLGGAAVAVAASSNSDAGPTKLRGVRGLVPFGGGAPELYGKYACPMKTLFDGDLDGMGAYSCWECPGPGSDNWGKCYAGHLIEKYRYTIDQGAYLFLTSFLADLKTAAGKPLAGGFYVRSEAFDYQHPIPEYRFTAPDKRVAPIVAAWNQLPAGVKTTVIAGLATIAAQLGLGIQTVTQVVTAATSIAQAATTLVNLSTVVTNVTNAVTATESALVALGAAATGTAVASLGFGLAVSAVMALAVGLLSAFPARGYSDEPPYLWDIPDRNGPVLLTPFAGGYATNYLNPSKADEDIPEVIPGTSPEWWPGPDEVTADTWFAGLVKLELDSSARTLTLGSGHDNGVLVWRRRVPREAILAYQASRANGASVSDSLGAVPQGPLLLSFDVAQYQADRKKNETIAIYWMNNQAFIDALDKKLGTSSADMRTNLGLSAGLPLAWKARTSPGTARSYSGLPSTHVRTRSDRQLAESLAASHQTLGHLAFAGAEAKRSGRIYGALPDDAPPHSGEVVVVYTPQMILDYATWLDRKVTNVGDAFLQWAGPVQYEKDGGAMYRSTVLWSQRFPTVSGASIPTTTDFSGWLNWAYAWKAYYLELQDSVWTQANATWDDVKAKHQELIVAANDARTRGLSPLPSVGTLPTAPGDVIANIGETVLLAALALGGLYVAGQFIASKRS